MSLAKPRSREGAGLRKAKKRQGGKMGVIVRGDVLLGGIATVDGVGGCGLGDVS